ncbi:MAG: hypothetical protein KatS3mg101_0355 [Patescibacteria group bacterium]|nr:MAG: hypothetical protein KatS3mg101_0355 [Patescibacteria group bacterium]
MRIGINGQRLLVKDPAGPERYTYNLINALAKIDHDNEYRIYFQEIPDKEYFSRLTYSNSSFKAVFVKSKISWTQVGLAIELKKNPRRSFFHSSSYNAHTQKQKLKGRWHDSRT